MQKYKGIWIDNSSNSLFRAPNNPEYPHSYYQRLLSPMEAKELIEKYGWKVI